MIFWQSSEATQDGYDLIASFVRDIEKKINENLEHVVLQSEYQAWKWAFIAIIMDHDEYRELVKRNAKHKVLEFRLQLDLNLLKHLDEKHRIEA